MKAERAAVIAEYLSVLATFGHMARAEANVHAQILPAGVRVALLQAGLLHTRAATDMVEWTPAGRAACGDAERQLRRSARRKGNTTVSEAVSTANSESRPSTPAPRRSNVA